MNQVDPTPARPHGTPRGWTRRRLSAIAAGAVLTLVGLGLALVGATLLAQSSQGEVDLGQAQIDSAGDTVVSGPVDWSTETYLGAPIEQVRFEVQTAPDTTPVLLALADHEKLAGHLPGQGTVVDGGFRFDYTEHSAASAELAEAQIWTARADGTGQAQLTFNARQHEGEQALVLTNVDGDPLTAEEIRSYGAVPGAAGLAVAMLGGAVVALTAGVVLIVVSLRRARRPSASAPALTGSSR